ncbi:MAG: uroporphyrinogen decarboxylase family protein, partial [Planctomycetota bacterium]
MMRALKMEKPDRLPVTIHQWQQWHLDKYMGGMDSLSAFRATGLDASTQYFEAMGQFWIPLLHHTITTPGGTLTYKTAGNLKTTWITEYLIKRHEDIDLIEKYMPVARLDKEKVAAEYDAVGDAGILRGFVWGDQAGCWQHACCLMDIQQLIMETFDNPDWVHSLMQVLLDKKVRFIEESLAGAKFDLIETGGGASSDTVISPKVHREFCLPYDRQMHLALHEHGFISTYHTCGGMMNLLDL